VKYSKAKSFRYPTKIVACRESFTFKRLYHLVSGYIYA